MTMQEFERAQARIIAGAIHEIVRGGKSRKRLSARPHGRVVERVSRILAQSQIFFEKGLDICAKT